MEGNSAFLVVLVATLAAVSGLPAPTKTRCEGRIWSVVGKHFAPRECQSTGESISSWKFPAQLTDEEKKEVSRIWKDLGQGKPKETIDQQITCNLCSAAVDTYKYLVKANHSKEEVKDTIVMMCVKFNVMTPKICQGTLDVYGDPLIKVIESFNGTSHQMCSYILNLKCGEKDYPQEQWTVTLPPNKKPPVLKPTPVPDAVKKLKVLHLTDTHWDPKYAEGTWSECKAPLCCRKENVPPTDSHPKAGKYGGWKCDLPESTLDDLLEHLKKQHPDIDYVLWTGDLPPHDIWEQKREDNLNALKQTTAKLLKAFPKTPVFPALGNHESVPSNLFPVKGKNDTKNPMDWLYDELSVQWTNWLPKNLTNAIRTGAFYTTLIRPGFRLVSLNMNFCYSFNWHLILNSVDPLNELHWFAQLLQEAEDKNEVVHVIGHIPPGNSDCLAVWQANYYKIISRYENVVTAQFFGHTHNDRFEIYYDSPSMRPVGVGYVAPSVTTYTYLNPQYRIYYIEGDHANSRRFVVDHESWYTDLEKANRELKTDWKILYTAKKAYNMSSLYPADWENVYSRMNSSDDVLQMFHRYYWSDSPKRPVCDDNCKREHLCEIRSCRQYGLPGFRSD